ncbi:MAG: hypothetical protein HAW60_05745 [Bdellovibrionales bacterium]|nr:hypothetical protein [Bdellovibrionales bacterium]
MTNQFKKQKIYFISLGALGVALISSLILLGTNFTEENFYGSSQEADITQCLEDCSKEQLLEKLKQIQLAIKNKNASKPLLKADDKIEITSTVEKFKKQLDSIGEKLNALSEKTDKVSEKHYNKYMMSLIGKLDRAKTSALKLLKITDFETGDKKDIKKYVNLKINLVQIENFLLDHFHDLNISYATEKRIDMFLFDYRIDKNLLSALLNEHQARGLAEKVEVEQKKNTDNVFLQIQNNSDLGKSIILHQQAQHYIFSLQVHKQNNAFRSEENKWIISQIDKAEKYISSAENSGIYKKYIDGVTKNKNSGKNSHYDNDILWPTQTNRGWGSNKNIQKSHGWPNTTQTTDKNLNKTPSKKILDNRGGF